MRKTVWGPRKCDVVLGVVLGRPSIYKGDNVNKHRRHLHLRMKCREYKPKGGYPRYTVKRSKPYAMYSSENYFEECDQFWKDEFE